MIPHSSNLEQFNLTLLAPAPPTYHSSLAAEPAGQQIGEGQDWMERQSALSGLRRLRATIPSPGATEYRQLEKSSEVNITEESLNEDIGDGPCPPCDQATAAACGKAIFTCTAFWGLVYVLMLRSQQERR